jgi:hypothetical protein
MRHVWPAQVLVYNFSLANKSNKHPWCGESQFFCVLISFIYNLGLTNKPIKVPRWGYMLALTTKG